MSEASTSPTGPPDVRALYRDPAVKNYLSFQGDSRAINSFYYTWWVDPESAPLKRA